jgi:hypothetical protein
MCMCIYSNKKIIIVCVYRCTYTFTAEWCTDFECVYVYGVCTIKST